MNTNDVQNELSTLERLTAPTPGYFRAIQIMAIIFGAAGFVIAQLQDAGFILPAWMAVLSEKATLAVDAVLVIFPQLTVDFKELSRKKTLENIR